MLVVAFGSVVMAGTKTARKNLVHVIHSCSRSVRDGLQLESNLSSIWKIDGLKRAENAPFIDGSNRMHR
jgi:hypothetical protein